jgi:hypothetical protein
MNQWLSPIKPPFGTPLNREHPLAQGLAAMYLMNEGCGDLVHDSCGMNDGKMIAMAPMSPTSGWVPGPHGVALAFPGSNEYVQTSIPAPSVLTFADGQDWTVIFGMAGLALNGPTGLFAGKLSYGPYFGIGSDGTYFREGEPYNSLYRWYFTVPSAGLLQIAFTVSGSILTGGCNGVWFSGQTPHHTYLNMERLAGVAYIGGGGYFTGLVSSVSIYNRALSAEEIAYLYAFPWCMFNETPFPAWMMKQTSALPYYQHLLAGDRM